MAYGAAADEGLGHLGHGDGRRHASVGTAALQRVLQSNGVDHRRQHPHVVAGHAIDALSRAAHPPENVPAPDDDGDLHAGLLHVNDLVGDVRQNVGLDTVAPPAHERFTREFEKDAFVTRRHWRRFI